VPLEIVFCAKIKDLTMKIYLASSWKNETLVIVIANILRKAGHEVDAFCDSSLARFEHQVYHVCRSMPITSIDAKDAFRDSRFKDACREEIKWLDWCDCCLLILPSGKSSHLEAGYAKAKGKKLIIYHAKGFPAGDIDVMYNFADLLTEELDEIKAFLKKWGES
jgi:nucleoside 2-deoxyribosyltransferase